MSMVSDPDIVSFSAEILEKHGGVIERHDERLHALLPPDLAGELDVADDVELGAPDTPLIYGSPLLDRLVGLATRNVPVAYGHIVVPYLKRPGSSS